MEKNLTAGRSELCTTFSHW